MFGYRNPLQAVEFELSSTITHPYDEINLNLVESDLHNNKSASSHGHQHQDTDNGLETTFDGLQSFQIVNGGIYKKFVHCVAIIDIVYSLLRLALHFLELLTGGVTTSASRQRTASTYTIHNTTNNGPVDEIVGYNDDKLKITTSAFSYETQERDKSNQTLTVAIWSGKFLICIVQLIVASALYSGTTHMKDSRICIRNCRIWIFTTCFLILILIFELCGIFILGQADQHILAIITCSCEFVARLVGIILVWKFIKQLKFQLCDLEQDEHIIYYELCPSPGPSRTTTPGGNNSSNHHQHST